MYSVQCTCALLKIHVLKYTRKYDTCTYSTLYWLDWQWWSTVLGTVWHTELGNIYNNPTYMYVWVTNIHKAHIQTQL